MLHAIRSRLTYANVMATGAMFVALGGGAYALSGVPDRSGVYHACVDDKTGALRVVARASSCQKATTVKRGGRRIRIPGESAIAWSRATNVIVRSKALGSFSGGTDVADFAPCNPGERAVGGGMSRSDGRHTVGDTITQSAPAIQGNRPRLANAGETPDAWLEGLHTGGAGTFNLYAICASP